MSPPAEYDFERSRSAADLYTAGVSSSSDTYRSTPSTYDCDRDNESDTGRTAALVKSKKSSSSSNRRSGRNSVSPSKRSSSPNKRPSKSSDKSSAKQVSSSIRGGDPRSGDISPLSNTSRSTVSTRTARRSSGNGSSGSGCLSSTISSIGGPAKKSSAGVSSYSSTSTTSSSSSSRSSKIGDSSEELNLKREQRRKERNEERKRERERPHQPQQEQIAMQQELRLQQLKVLEREILLQQQQSRSNKQMEIERRPQVTFSVGPDGGVASTFHWYDNENFPALWWQEDELMGTLRVCMKTVHELRGVRGRDYVKSITRLYHSYKVTVTESQTARSLQVIASMDDARGLEQHVAQKLRAQSGQARKLVLELQQRLRHPNSSKLVDFSEHDVLLRKESMKHSRPSRQFAFMIAQYDTHEALQASLSSWREDDDQELSMSSF